MDDIFDQLLEGGDNKSGDEHSDREDDENNAQNDEKEEKRRVVKVQRRILNKRPTLDVMRLTGPRGLSAIEDLSKNVLLKGKGHETEDLATIMTLLQYWTHRLYPKMTFEDCIEKIENLGKKRSIQTYLTKMRLGMLESTDSANTIDDSQLEELNESKQPTLTDEQKERILKNRMIAQARRATKLQASNTAPRKDSDVASLENSPC